MLVTQWHYTHFLRRAETDCVFGLRFVTVYAVAMSDAKPVLRRQ